MKTIYLIFFLLILSCNSIKKEYVCGDHPCLDKKEFKEYFSKNFIVEIKSKDKNKNKKSDLVKLNTESSDKQKKNNKNLKISKKMEDRKEIERQKKEKIRLLQERKISELEKKNKIKEEKKLAKYDKKNKKIINKKIPPKNKKKIVKIPEEKITAKPDTTQDMESVCGKIKDCDINKITELLIKKGRNKPFPDITSN